MKIGSGHFVPTPNWTRPPHWVASIRTARISCFPAGMTPPALQPPHRPPRMSLGPSSDSAAAGPIITAASTRVVHRAPLRIAPTRTLASTQPPLPIPRTSTCPRPTPDSSRYGAAFRWRRSSPHDAICRRRRVAAMTGSITWWPPSS